MTHDKTRNQNSEQKLDCTKMVSQFFVTLCGQLAPITAFVVFLSPLPTVNEMRKNQSVGILPLLPYSTMVVNCFLWTLYGKEEASHIGLIHFFLKFEHEELFPNFYYIENIQTS